jgi:hypothetical protein
VHEQGGGDAGDGRRWCGSPTQMVEETAGAR